MYFLLRIIQKIIIYFKNVCTEIRLTCRYVSRWSIYVTYVRLSHHKNDRVQNSAINWWILNWSGINVQQMGSQGDIKTSIMTLLIPSIEFNFLGHCQKASFCQEPKSNLRYDLRNRGHLVSSNIRRTDLNHFVWVTKGTFDQGLKMKNFWQSPWVTTLQTLA